MTTSQPLDLADALLDPSLYDGTAPWDRREGETARSYDAFCAYRDQRRPRSLARCATSWYAPEGTAEQRAAYTATPGQLRQFQEWSRLNGWVSRVEAWDAHLDLVSRLTQIESVKTMRERAANVSSAGMSLVARQVSDWIKEGRELTPAEATRLLEVCWKVECAAREVASDVQQSEVTVRLEDERAEALALMADARQRLQLIEGGGAG